MIPFIAVVTFISFLSFIPGSFASGGEATDLLPGSSIETTTTSTESYILEGKLLNIQKEYWIVEDMDSHQHRIHVGKKTTLPFSPKQPGDSIQAVVKANGLALLIQ